jgi:dipeptidyl aminopeptidase/acylaminoacyl peptidase
MSKLTFENADLQRVVAQMKRNHDHGYRAAFAATPEPAFWLVGDQGVYVMSNVILKDEKPEVAYAVECNPNTVEDWDQVKRATFGGDDGVEKIPITDMTLKNIEDGKLRLIVEMDEMSFKVDIEVAE